MDFVASMTFRLYDLRAIVQMWQQNGDSRDPFARIIFTPLFARSGVIQLIRKHFQARSSIMFDSGGYFVQQGITSYEDLYQNLLTYYRENDWADWYVLPDYVPTSSLSSNEVEARVQATVTIGKLFFTEMPALLRERALPVVQGHNLEQIKYCVDSYAELGVQYIGFGSFGTSGENNSINTITRQSIQMIEFIKQQAENNKLKIHLFGIGTPAVLPLFNNLGVDSFDSSCWSRTAGFGNVYLPFIGRRNITGRMLREVGGQAYTRAKFNELKDATGHKCPFCEDVDILKTNRIYQMMHNLYVLIDTVEALNRGQVFVPELVGIEPSRYQRYL